MPAWQLNPCPSVATRRKGAAQRLWVSAGLTILLLSACAVGPDFQQPVPPTGDGYGPEAPPSETAAAPTAHGTAQRLEPGRDIPGEWWALFGSTLLNGLIAEALKNSPNITAAAAALRQAHELTLAGEGAFFPTAQASLTASRNKTSASLSPSAASGSLYFSQYSAQLGVSYVPDVFGGTRRQVESLTAQEEAQRFQLEAAYLTMTANLVAAAVTEASLRGQIAAAEKIIRIQRDSLEILRRQFGLGQVAGQEVATVEAALAQAEASLPPLHKQLGQQRHLIAVLAGRLPADEPQAPFDLAGLQLPQEVPLSLPSKLVDQRPDVRAAEANLHAASAQVGVAVAARLPQFSLTGNVGTTALTLAGLAAPGNIFWTFAGNVAQTVFDAGTLFHKQRAAEAALDGAKAQYRETVLTAFQNVADALHALQDDATLLKAAAASETAAKKSLDIARRQLQLGAVNNLALLTAENAYQTALSTRVQAEAARLSDTAALFQALGGGWWNRSDVGPQNDEGLLSPSAFFAP
ncbi:MAG: efflux transporter outer membrane subunit [Alphaproteobacteria bacterium]|nr:efflux transporter outer membrane subunit [Alphaproteobacteria bacterium]